MLDWAERVGFRVPDRLAFGRMGLPGEYRGRFRNDWEPLLWFVKPGGDPFFDKRAIAAPALYPELSRATTTKGRRPDGSQVIESTTDFDTIQRGSLWGYGSIGGGQSGAPDIEAENHPARWPYKLADDIVRCFCPPDGLACDPFLGAGTSAVAAFEHGRRFIGGDLGARPADAERGLDAVPWVEVARRVLDARARQGKLFG
jgi:DNA modification methylase